jgi:hypothetical protein
METNTLSTIRRASGLALCFACLLAGCKHQPSAADDAELTSKVQSTVSSDQNLAGQTIQATAVAGVVTLNGAVSSDSARTIANQDAAQVAGVKTVVDNLVVEGESASATAPQRTGKPAPGVAQNSPPAPVERYNPTAPPAPQPGPGVQQAPPPPPVAHTITLPAGTDIPVRITQTLNSATTQTGERFTGVVASDIIVDNLVVLPQGALVTGHVDDAHDAAHFKGSSLLTISLTSIDRRGERIDVATEPYTREGVGRGKNTVEKVGGGAAIGAILGGIFGGGKGAAIGSVAGGGVGAGAQGVTRGQQVEIPSETVVRFKLSSSILVHVPAGGASTPPSNGLERRSDE